jgi:hypothetical protein
MAELAEHILRNILYSIVLYAEYVQYELHAMAAARRVEVGYRSLGRITRNALDAEASVL